ncbi:MAG: PAS domain S-box protein [Sedimentisphaerales bacterium]|nr:PAS domain S-box protein [Sedimentisphaerales bacterium]
MLMSEDEKKPIEKPKTAHSHNNKSMRKNSDALVPTAKSEYKETILLFSKMLVTIFLCEAAIMTLLHIIPLSRGWEIFADSLLLTALGTLILYGLFVRPVWLSLKQRNLALESLRLSERNLVESQKIANLGSWEMNLVTNEETWSDQIYRLLGFEPGEVTPCHETFLSTVHPDDRGMISQAVQKAISENKPYEMEFRVVRKDGTERIMHSRGEINFDESGKPVRIVGMGQDITERKKTEEAIRKSENLYRTLVEANPYGIQEIDSSGFITYTNPAYQKILGYTEQELLGKSILDLLEPESKRNELQDYLSEVVKEQPQPKTYYQKNRTKDNRIIDMAVDWNYKRDNEGRIIGFTSVITDITKRKKADDKLVWLNELMMYIISHARSCIAVHDRDLKYIFVSERYLKEYKVKEKDVIGKHHYEIFPDLPQKWRDVHQRVLLGEVLSEDEDPYVREDGSVDWTTWECRPWYNSDGSIGGIIVYTEIINDRKHAEQKILENQAQLKSLASQLSITEERERRRIATELHDQIGQSLVFSKIKLDELHQSAPSGELTKTLDEICNNIGQIIQDTRSLTFDLSSPILNQFGLEAAVADWLEVQIGAKHGIETEFEDDGRQKPLDDDIRALLFRNVRELLVNVIKHADANKVKVSIQRVNEHIHIDVEDDGKGFNTVKVTSRAAKDTKFGLFSIKERLEQLGGHFQIDSEPGRGSKFSMTTPLKLAKTN